MRGRSRFEAEHCKMETCCTLDVFIVCERTWAKTAGRTGQILGKYPEDLPDVGSLVVENW